MSSGLPDRANNTINRICRSVAIVAVSLMLVMIGLTAADVFGRYAFDSPIFGAYEITQMLVLVVIGGAMAYAAVTKTHVSIEVITSRLSDAGQAAMIGVASLVSFGFFGLVVWHSILQSGYMLEREYVLGALESPSFPLPLIWAICSALVCLVLIPPIIANIAKAWKEGMRYRFGMFLGIAFVAGIFAIALAGQERLLTFPTLLTGMLGIALMLVFMFMGVWVGVAIGMASVLGVTYVSGMKAGFGLFGSTYLQATSYTLAVIPLFIVMGEFANQSGLSRDLYITVNKWLGHLPGGLAMASVGACAGFAAVSGSSVATAASMGSVAIPEMRKYRYDTALATGAVAAGSTMGILIPPSIILVIYGILAEQPIGPLFIAGVIPGLLEAVFYIMTIYILCKIRPERGPRGVRSNFRERVVSLKDTWPVIALFLLVVGGMYTGVFTPTEAAGMGAFGTLILVILKRRLSRQTLITSLLQAGGTAAMVFLFIIGAGFMDSFLALSRFADEMAAFVAGLQVNRYFIIAGILLMYMILGCFMSTMAVIVVTVPIFIPLINALGFHPIWYGIIIVRMMEIGSITPPLGISVFVIKGILPDVPLYTVFRGIVPFLIADICHVALLVAVPQLALFLPSIL